MRIAVLVLLACICSCSPPCDSFVGTMMLTMTFGEGDCGLEGSEDFSVIVANHGGGQMQASGGPVGSKFTKGGQLQCDASMEFERAFLRYSMTVDIENPDELTGGGIVTGIGAIACQQSITITGVIL